MTVTILDPAFEALVEPGAGLERLWTGGIWVEGPVWMPDGRLIWSDIPSNRLLVWDEATGETATFRQPSGGANGNTLDREGRLVTCEGSRRRLTRTGADGTVTVLASHAGGRRFHSPNDVVVARDGAIWFTDPSYGGPDYEGRPEIAGCHVWRLDPATGPVTQMTVDMVMPNGLAFSPDESHLYVVDTGSTNGPGFPNHIRRFGVTPGGLTGGEVLHVSAAQSLDGLRVDRDGNLWCGEADGVHVLTPEGRPIGRIDLPERAANLTFGGEGWLYMTATTSLYRLRVRARPA